MEDLSLIQWPGWETVRLIGRGSFGAVYEIRRELYGVQEKAALKHIRIPQSKADVQELYNDGYDEESITAAFESHLKGIVAEYALMRKLNGSTNVVNCDDFRVIEDGNEIGWDIYIKMELLTPLTETLKNPIRPETAVKLGTDLCTALVLCRKHSIVHRDIKPQNIFVSEGGDYKLGDFGIAKTVEKTMGGTKTGTYKYMAPEVYNNRPYGHSADIYSLGLVLYWMLNRKRMPFMPLPPEKLKAGMDEQARNRRLSGEALPPPADGSPELRRIVLKACAYDPADRYRTAEELLEDLQALRQRAQPLQSREPAPAGAPTPAAVPAAPLTDAPAPAAEPAAAEAPPRAVPSTGEAEDETVGLRRPRSAPAVAPPPPEALPEEEATVLVEPEPAPEASAPTAPEPEPDAPAPTAPEPEPEIPAPTAPEPEPEAAVPAEPAPEHEDGRQSARSYNFDALAHLERLEQLLAEPVGTDAAERKDSMKPAESEPAAERAEARSDENAAKTAAAAKPAKPKKRRKKGLVALIGAAALLLIGAAISFWVVGKSNDYRQAEKLYAEKRYAEAEEQFLALGSFRDAEERVYDCQYQQAAALLADGDWEAAKQNFLALGAYSDAADRAVSCEYVHAEQLIQNNQLTEARELYLSLGDTENAEDVRRQYDYFQAKGLLEGGKYDEAKKLFLALKDYSDASDLAKQCDYEKAAVLLEGNDYAGAKALYQSLGSYSDAADMAKECDYRKAKHLLREKDYDAAASLFAELGSYSDAERQEKESRYKKGISLFNSGDLSGAKEIFESLGDYSSSSLLIECDYRLALQELEAGNYEAARTAFLELGDYKYSELYAKVVCEHIPMISLLKEKNGSKLAETMYEFADKLLFNQRYWYPRSYLSDESSEMAPITDKDGARIGYTTYYGDLANTNGSPSFCCDVFTDIYYGINNSSMTLKYNGYYFVYSIIDNHSNLNFIIGDMLDSDKLYFTADVSMDGNVQGWSFEN